MTRDKIRFKCLTSNKSLAAHSRSRKEAKNVEFEDIGKALADGGAKDSLSTKPTQTLTKKSQVFLESIAQDD